MTNTNPIPTPKTPSKTKTITIFILIITAFLIIGYFGAGLFVKATTKTLTGTELSQQLTQQITTQYGVAPQDIQCPQPITLKENATSRCTFYETGKKYNLNVTITSITNGTPQFQFKSTVVN